MKKVVLALILSLLFFNNACEDNLNPFQKGEDKFIFNCVLKNDRSEQSAFLSKSYFVDNFDPLSNLDDHSVKDAYVRVFFGDSVKIFSDSLVEKFNFDNSYTLTNYYNNNFLTKPDTKYDLEIVLNDGRKITSTTTTPKTVVFSSKSDGLIPPPNKKFIRVSWESKAEQLYTAARFIFVYFKNENGVQVRYEKEVPRTYAFENGEYKPFFPEPSYDSYIQVEINAFDRALKEISIGDPNKSNYTILAFILEILVYDKNLTAYYAAKTELGDGFSITTNESDFSNIKGGRGIFGSFIKQRRAVKFSLDYINSFGYIPGLTEARND